MEWSASGSYEIDERGLEQRPQVENVLSTPALLSLLHSEQPTSGSEESLPDTGSVPQLPLSEGSTSDALSSNPHIWIDVTVDDDGNTLLHLAARRGSLRSCKSLLSRGSSVDPLNSDQMSPLHLAASQGHDAVCEFLITAGASAIICDDLYGHPLHLAAEGGHSSTCRTLLDFGADVHGCDYVGQTPLHKAAEGGFTETIEVLLSHGADVDAADACGNTALHEAAYGGHVGVASLLLEAGASAGVFNNRHETPLHLAVSENHEGTCRLMLQVIRGLPGASSILNAQNEDGATALHLAGWKARALCAILLEEGACVEVVNKSGLSTVDIARSVGDGHVAGLLRSIGAM